MSLRLLLVVTAFVLFFAKTANAQETFGAADTDGTATPAAAATPAPYEGDEWWHAKPAVLPAKRPPKPMALRFDGAFAPRRLFGLGVGGADMGVGLGVQTSQYVAWWWATRVSIGSTENGLGVWSGRTGAEVEAVINPVRFGLGAGALMMGVDRAARDQTLHSYGVEGRLFFRVDCWRSDELALFLRAAIDAGVEVKSGAAFWGPGIGAGFELGVRGKRPAEWAAAAPPIPML